MNLNPTPTISPKGTKSGKKAPNLAESKQKAVLPKPKLIDYTSRFQKYV